MPKSKATMDLINKLVSQKKILVGDIDGKIYYVGESDKIKELKLMLKYLEDELKKYPHCDNKFYRKFNEFLKTRIKVLESEAKHTDEFDYGDTLYLIVIFRAIMDNPTKLGDAFLLDALDWAIKDDKYYLKHQSHASPKKIKPDYYKSKKVPRRRGIIDLLDMKKKGMQSRYKYGLKSNSAFNNQMKNFGDDPANWFNRVFVEEDRMLYKDTSKLKMEIYKKILNSIQLKKDDPDYEIKKKLLDAEKKSFPHIQMIDISEILPNKLNSFTETLPPKDWFEKKCDKMLEICVSNVIKKGFEENYLRRTVKTLTKEINKVIFSASNYNRIMRGLK